MSKVRYSATFQLPNGEEFVFTRESREDYGYTWAWLLLEIQPSAGFSLAAKFA
jgi:hypothetical protein